MKFVTIGEIITIKKGKKPLFTETPSRNSVRVLQIDDLRNDDNIKYTDEKFGVLANEDDILIAWDGANAGTIGFGKSGYIGSTIAVLKKNVPKKYSTVYIGKFLQSQFEHLRRKSTGATIPHIDGKSLRDLKIPQIDIADQILIAEILSQAESLIVQRKESIGLLDAYLKSTFLEMFGDPVMNEKGLKKVKLIDITTKITDGKHGDCTDEENSGYYFLSAKDLVNGELKYHNVREITQVDFIEVHKRTDLKINDILLGNTGASIGKIGIVKDKEKASKTVFQKSISIISVKDEIILPHYLKSYLDYNRSIFNATSTGSAMPNLLLSQIRSFDIIVPPIKLQSEFIRVVEKVEALKNQYQQSLAELDNMYGVLSQKAFRGELK